MQRHCLSSQTFDKKPEQACVEALHSPYGCLLGSLTQAVHFIDSENPPTGFLDLD